MAVLYLDADTSPTLAGGLRLLSHDVVTATDLDLRHVRDDRQLAAAFQRRRVLVTHNARDFTLLHYAWRRWSTLWHVDPSPEHDGILVIPQHPHLPHDEAVREIDELLRSGASLTNALYVWQRLYRWRRARDEP